MESELRLDERNDETGVRNGLRGYPSSLTSEGRTISAPQLVISESALQGSWLWRLKLEVVACACSLWRCWKRIFVFV